MRIAITGKGGVGKTTIAGALARIVARSQQRVLALDADSNPNLAMSLGIPPERLAQVAAVPPGLTEWREDAGGKAYVHFNRPVEELVNEHGITAPDGVRLLVMGEVLKASTGCRCEAHAVARGLTARLAAQADVAILDMEAGLEHLGRGTAEHVDILLIVVEPYYRALEAATRIRDLAAQLPIPHILVVANRIRTQEEAAAVAAYCASHQLELIASIPFDHGIPQAEQQGLAAIDVVPASSALRALGELAAALSARLA